MNTEKQVGMAAKMYEQRRTLKSLWKPEKYMSETAIAAKCIEVMMRAAGIGILPAAIRLVQEIGPGEDESGIVAAVILCAALDMIEPIPETP